MVYSPLAIKRSFVLGDLYNRCEISERTPVYIDAVTDEPAGYVDSSPGAYADAFLFHLPEDICKKLSTGHFRYGFDYDNTEQKNRFKLNFIVLISNAGKEIERRTPLAKPKA
jgi:hypothetical protein